MSAKALPARSCSGYRRMGSSTRGVVAAVGSGTTRESVKADCCGARLSAGCGGLGGWTAGARPRVLPHDLAYKLPKGADLLLSTHFHPSGKAEEEASTVALYFADKAPPQRFTGLQVPFGFGIVAFGLFGSGIL